MSDEAALEPRRLELDVHLAVVRGRPEARAEIASLAWARADHAARATVAPAVRNHVLPELAARGLID